MELALSVCVGIGLAAACGFRVFVPFLGISLAALAGHVQLADGMAWIGTWPAFICFLTATVLEIGAYYVPWIDNLLDSISTPAAMVAGTIAVASVVTDMSPMMRWTLALIAGGGTAGLIQASTVAIRGTSTATTAGTANWLVATCELLASIGATMLSMLMPFVAAAAVALIIICGLMYFFRKPVGATAHEPRGTSF